MRAKHAEQFRNQAIELVFDAIHPSRRLGRVFARQVQLEKGIAEFLLCGFGERGALVFREIAEFRAEFGNECRRGLDPSLFYTSFGEGMVK